jgi:hypothetical protein
MNIIFALTLVYDFMHFRFKLDVFETYMKLKNR